MKFILRVFLFLAISLSIFSCFPSEQESTYPELTSITESVYASGLIKAVNQYEAFANNTGPIQEIFVKEGDLVEEGTPILAIYNERERLNRENAELAQVFDDYQQNQSKLRDLQLTIDFAKSKMQNDSMLFVRQKNLWEKNIGTAVDLEQRRLSFENSQTAYESALIRYQDLKREIEFNSKSASKSLAISRALESEFVLKSRIKGKVYALPKEKGEMVNPQTPVAILGSENHFLMELQIDEYDISKIEIGQQVIVTMDSYKGETFQGIVSRIFPLMDSKSKSFTVEATFTKEPKVLYPNLSLEANIITATAENSLVIPRNFLINDELVINSDGDTIPVKIGIRNFQFAQVLEGIGKETQLIKP